MVLARGLGVPALDEETWLWLAAHAPLARPYDWWRPGPPWGDAPAADALVFAHPPLFLAWLKAASPLAADLADLRRVAALPWAALLGLAAGALAERAPRPWVALAALLSCPAALLAVGRGLMPDLMATSLLTAALVAWLAASRGAGGRGAWVAGGLLLAAAGFTRYPALILAPALALDALLGRRARASWPFWLAFLLPLLAGEGWLYALYGRVHLWEVLSRAGEIPRGPWGGRLLGTLARLGLALGPLALVAAGRRSALLAFLLGGAALALGAPDGLSPARAALLLALAVLGALALVAGGLAARAEEDRPLALLALLVALGVLVGHNYAAARYLLPGLAPLALLLAKGARPRLGWAAVGAQLLLGLALLRAESAYAVAADAVAATVAGGTAEKGSFTGEWTFRWRMEREGWTFRASPPTEGLVAVPRNAGPSWGPGEGWVSEAHASAGLGRLRLLDLEEGVGYYAETLGPLPLGWRPGRLEEASVWRAR